MGTLLGICQKSWEPSFWEVMNSFVCFISMCKFHSFKNPFPTITSLSQLDFLFRRFILLVETKDVISMNYGSSKSSRKPWRWVRLIFTWRIYTSVPTWFHSQNSLAAVEALSLKDILPWNISQMIIETCSISTRIVISYAMK